MLRAATRSVSKKVHVKIFIKPDFTLPPIENENYDRIEQSVFYTMSPKNYLLMIVRGRYQFVEVSLSLSARMSSSGNIDADNSWSFAAVYRGGPQYRSFSIRFRAISHGAV